jgi:gas vesicle protein
MSKNNKSTVEKLVLGAIIGAAVGSVIGASVAPEQGKQNRAKLNDKIKSLTSEFKEKIEQQDQYLKPEKKSTIKKYFSRLINLFKPND